MGLLKEMTRALRFLVTAFALYLAACAAAPPRAPPFAEVVRAAAARNGLPAHVPTHDAAGASWDCAWRSLASEVAAATMPWLLSAQTRDLADALQLAALNCSTRGGNVGLGVGVGGVGGVGGGAAGAVARAAAARVSEADLSIYVDFARGDDGNAGTQASPVKTIARAVALVRAARQQQQQQQLSAAVVLRGGRHFLDATVELSPGLDDNTAFASFPGEVAELSAGASVPPAALAWAPAAAPAPAGAWSAPFSRSVTGLAADLSALPALFVDGRRATLARFPDADPERDAFPVGWITSSGAWQAPDTSVPVAEFTETVELPVAQQDPAAGVYANFTRGWGGMAARFDPPVSFWASRDFGPQAWQPTATYDRWIELHLRSPSGIDYGQALPRAPYKNLSQAVCRSWHPNHWFSWGWRVAQAGATLLNFTSGGDQGGEGNDEGAEWFIEGVAEELTTPNEYFFDVESQTLTFFPNATGGGGAPPSIAELVAPQFARLFSLRGGQERPLANVSFINVSFSQGSPSFMVGGKGVPSGGDWALEREAALFVEGTVGTTVSGCLFTRLETHAIFLSNYNRNASVVLSEFAWLAASAIVAWGSADGADGTGGDQPRFSLIEGNVAHELGVTQKQSSFFVSAVSCENTVRANLAYNLPRAAVCFLDRFGGADLIEGNILFNTCRESGDHGAINYWARQPYITFVRDGSTPSAIPAFTDIRANLIVSNYQADAGCVDTDDGSSWLRVTANACFFGGHKSAFDGHAKLTVNNLMLFPQIYGPGCLNMQVTQFTPTAHHKRTVTSSAATLTPYP